MPQITQQSVTAFAGQLFLICYIFFKEGLAQKITHYPQTKTPNKMPGVFAKNKIWLFICRLF